MWLAYLCLISGLTISAVAVYYSVAGLVSIFAAAAIPIMIMGVALELSKLVATVWLKQNWYIAPKPIKWYLTVSVIVLMLITSMGIFGFLSKAHLDQNLVGGDVVDKVAIIDEKIKTQKDNIDAARKALRQMDEAVDQTMARSTSEQGADKAAALRRNQQRERTQLQNDIAKAQSEIAKLNEQRAPIAKELRAVEAEVGPIKYIAKLIYGDNPDANLLEKAVTWVIMIIIFVFDPLAILLLLASQLSFQWLREKKENEDNPEEFFEKAREVAQRLDESNNQEIDYKNGFLAQETEIEIPSEYFQEDVYVSKEIVELPKEQIVVSVPPSAPWNSFSEESKIIEVVETVEPKNESVEDTELVELLEESQKEIERLRKELAESDSKKMSDDLRRDIQNVYSENERLKEKLSKYEQPEATYVQNEEQKQSGLWKAIHSSTRISEEEYLEQSQKKKNDNPNNAA